MANMHIIPLKQDKSPACGPGWKDEMNFEQNTQLVVPGEMYGVLTGRPNNILVVDWDCYSDKCEFPITEDFLAWKAGGKESAYIVRTRSGGYHTYFAWDDERFGDWKGTVGIEGFIDIRTTDNYVVGPDSPGYELLRGDIKNLPQMPNDLYSFLDGKVGHKVERADTECSYTQASVTPLLEDMGFTGIRWLSGATSYDFECDQCRPSRGSRVAQCPCCGGFHEGNGRGGGNHFYVAELGLSVLTVKNHGNCRARQFRFEVGCLIHGITQKEQNEIRAGTSAGYIEVRREFEKHVAKINKDVIFVDDDYTEVVKYSKSALKDRYESKEYTDSTGAKRKFIGEWLLDDNKREYKRMNVVPQDCPSNTYNLWRGFAVESVPVELGLEGEAESFKKLLAVLCGHEGVEYALDWFAHLVQFPGKKLITALVFRGIQGTGKGHLFTFLKEMFGKGKGMPYYETSNAKKSIFGNYCNPFEGRKLVVINEAKSSTSFDNNEEIKNLVTDVECDVNEKFVPMYTIDNISSLIFGSNSATPVYVEFSDRRFVIYTPDHTYVVDTDGFLKWFREEYTPNKANQRAVYDMLMARDLSNFDPKEDRPLTKAYNQVRHNSLDSFLKWFDELITVAFPSHYTENHKVRNYDPYIRYWNTLSMKQQQDITEGKFRNRMTKLRDEKETKDPLTDNEMVKGSDKHGVFYQFNRQACFDWLTRNKLTMADKMLEAIDSGDRKSKYDL